MYTALATRALKTYMPAGRREEMLARTARALNFLRNASPADTQEAAFKLLGLVWAGAASGEITAQVKRVVALQRSDGGWGQLRTMPSDAYATGQSLYSLELGGLAPSSIPFRKGAQYLLKTQLEDGTWYVRSRAIGFQP